MKMSLRLAALSIFFCLIMTSYAFSGRGMGGLGRIADSPSSPTLISPVTEDVNLTGKDSLEFKWAPGNATMISYYDFRLYKGYNTVASALILKKEVPGGLESTEIKSDTLEVNQVYTWVLRVVSLGGEKSDKAYDSFKIIKK
jgi:hypothetical protein